PPGAFDYAQSDRLTQDQVGKTRMPQHFDMDEHIVGVTEDIGEAEPLRLVEPFHPRGLQGQRVKLSNDVGVEILDGWAAVAFWRVNLEDLHGLQAAGGRLDL